MWTVENVADARALLIAIADARLGAVAVDAFDDDDADDLAMVTALLFLVRVNVACAIDRWLAHLAQERVH